MLGDLSARVVAVWNSSGPYLFSSDVIAETMLPRLLAFALISAAATAGIFLLTWSMRRLGLRAQFVVLLALGILIGFIFMTIVQVPGIPSWVGISLIVIGFIAGLFGVRILLRSLSLDLDGGCGAKASRRPARRENPGLTGSRVLDLVRVKLYNAPA
jgi:hypothetical protein